MEGGIDIVGVGRAFASANFAHTRTLHVVHFYEGCEGMRIPKVYGLSVRRKTSAGKISTSWIMCKPIPLNEIPQGFTTFSSLTLKITIFLLCLDIIFLFFSNCKRVLII